MTSDSIDGRWIRSINDKLTFCGALEECYDDCAKYWRKEETKKQYARDYNDKIIPNLPEHDEKPIDEYSKEDYDLAISAIVEQGQGGKDGPFVPYADSTIQHYRHLIEVVVIAASNHGLCSNVLWGSCFSLEEDNCAEDEIRERVKLKKSLTIQQEQAVAQRLMSDPEQRGQEMGLFMMFALGVRNGEACGANYGDIMPMELHPECKALWVYKSTTAGTNIVHSSGKTRNADRIIPFPEQFNLFLDARRNYLEKAVVFDNENAGKSVDDLPIACVGKDFFTRCSANQLTAAGREMFRQIKLNEKQLAYIDAELSKNAVAEEMKERDPTAYLLRRNFGTHLHILGLTEAEIEYVIGHDIEDAYETRNEFVNEEKLYEIRQKLNKRPILNTDYQSDEVRELPSCPNQPIAIRGSVRQKLRLKMIPGQLKMRFTTQEPLDTLKLKMSVIPQTEEIRKTSCFSSELPKYERTVNILKKYHELYEKGTS